MLTIVAFKAEHRQTAEAAMVMLLLMVAVTVEATMAETVVVMVSVASADVRAPQSTLHHSHFARGGVGCKNIDHNGQRDSGKAIIITP